MFSIEGNSTTQREVVSAQEIQIEGYAAPLTVQGNLIANGIVVSCYANIKKQALGDFAMWPLKTFKWI